MSTTTELTAGTVMALLFTAQENFLPRSCRVRSSRTSLIALPVPFSCSVVRRCALEISWVPFHQLTYVKRREADGAELERVS